MVPPGNRACPGRNGKAAGTVSTRNAKPAPASVRRRTHAPGRRRVACCAAVVAGVLVGACSYCEDDMHGAWRVTYVNTADAANAAEAGIAAAPACEAQAKSAAQAAAQTTGTVVDPDLLEIARLEVERDCYKNAEKDLRQRVESLQPVSTDLK